MLTADQREERRFVAWHQQANGKRQVKSNGLLCWLRWSRICLQCWRPGFDPQVGKIPRRRERLPTPVFWPGEFQALCS